MKLKKLINDLQQCQIKGSKDIEITGVCTNSKVVSPGNIFIAKRGRTFDGHQFIPEALSAGATAIVTDMYDPSLTGVTQIIHPNPHEIEALLASRVYHTPSKKLTTIGITGTNGKTTTASLIKWILEGCEVRSGLISTIEYVIGSLKYEATHTTPDVCTIHKLLHEMVRQRCKAAVMEVTSHALDQGRVREVEFDLALFTNLTPEHLDYHKTMEQYAASKSLLFNTLSTDAVAIANTDSCWTDTLLKNCKAPFFTYAINKPADFQATELEITPFGSQFSIVIDGVKKQVSSPLSGRFNVYNLLAAIAAAKQLNLNMDRVIEALAKTPTVPGRLQWVPNNQDLKVYVDFAHTEDALKNVLLCLKEISSGRIITVFGCGGDRDRQKRPKMAQVAEAYSDLTIVTSDNPRSEDPEEICREIAQGFQSVDKYLIELDRRQAISKAISLAEPGDTLLIAGKGHEATQKFHHQTLPFDDYQTAFDLCRAKGEGILC